MSLSQKDLVLVKPKGRNLMSIFKSGRYKKPIAATAIGLGMLAAALSSGTASAEDQKLTIALPGVRRFLARSLPMWREMLDCTRSTASMSICGR